MHLHACDLHCDALPQCGVVFGGDLSTRQREERSSGLELPIDRRARELVLQRYLRAVLAKLELPAHFLDMHQSHLWLSR